MDILKAATDWAKAEVFASAFFIIFGVLFILASIGFWLLGKSEIAKAYIIPMLVAGILLLIIGIGLCYTNSSRITKFETAYNQDTFAFVQSEIVRTERTLNEYKTIVFTAIPLIITLCSLVILVVNTPVWRACMITTIAMLVVILLIDGTAQARIDSYNKQLIAVKKNLNSF